MKDFTRGELQKLETKAKAQADIYQLNTSGKRVYLRLAAAATTLDAFIARTEDHGKDIEEENK